jgi:hypothetical protein
MKELWTKEQLETQNKEQLIFLVMELQKLYLRSEKLLNATLLKMNELFGRIEKL